MAGPATRAPLNIEELSAIAFNKSSRPTISIRKDCRAGTSNAFTVPSSVARQIISHTRMRPPECPALQRVNASSIEATCVRDQPLAGAANGPPRVPARGDSRKMGIWLTKPKHSKQRRGAGQPINQPRLRNRLHPRAYQRDNLTAKEELKITVLQ